MLHPCAFDRSKTDNEKREQTANLTLRYLSMLRFEYPLCFHLSGPNASQKRKTCSCLAVGLGSFDSCYDVSRFIVEYSTLDREQKHGVIMRIYASKAKPSNSARGIRKGEFVYRIPGVLVPICTSALMAISGRTFRYWKPRLGGVIPGRRGKIPNNAIAAQRNYCNVPAGIRLVAKEVPEDSSDVNGPPFILPDRLSEDGTLKESVMDKTAYFVERAISTNTFMKSKREYIRNWFCEETNRSGDVFTIVAKDLNENGAVVTVEIDDPCVTLPTTSKCTPFRLCVALCTDDAAPAAVVELGQQLDKRCKGGNCRKDGGGSMWALGRRTIGSTIDHYRTAEEGANESLASRELLQRVQSLLTATIMGFKGFLQGSLFHPLLFSLRSKERAHNVIPARVLCGHEGVTATCVVSRDLYNESHVDVNDDGGCVSIFGEERPGTASNWYLCFPNMKICDRGRWYYGIRIALCHGAVVSWDGRVMKHFTSVTNVGTNNHVYSFFCGPCRKNIPKDKREDFVRDCRIVANK